MIYFNSSATSFHKPKETLRELNKLFYELSTTGREKGKSRNIVLEARKRICDFFNARDHYVFFTYNATYATNIIFQGLFKKDNHVITSLYEHNSVLRSLYHLVDIGRISLDFISATESGFSTEELNKIIKSETRAVSIMAASNVTGDIFYLDEIFAFCKEKNIITISDITQAAGNIKIDLETSKTDIAIFTGHKALFGITGIGGAIIKKEIVNNKMISPIMFGGTGNASAQRYQPEIMPHLLEPGTPNIFGAAALIGGLSFIEKKTLPKIQKKNAELRTYFIKKLNELSNVKIFEIVKNNPKLPVISFIIKGIKSSEICNKMDRHDIHLRCGLHCSPLIHKELCTYENGTIRVSFDFFNKKKEIDTFIKILKKMI